MSEEIPQVFKKRPVEVAAIQYTGKNLTNIRKWFADCHINKKNPGESYLYIKTLEGVIRADINDWIIRGIKGEYYPCKPEIFEKTYRLNDYKMVTKDLKYVMKLKNKVSDNEGTTKF